MRERSKPFSSEGVVGEGSLKDTGFTATGHGSQSLEREGASADDRTEAPKDPGGVSW